jgi:hypothetical protein
MVPNISPNGRSFRGAGAYHLHDKPVANDQRPSNANRVLFTATRNLANDDHQAALDEMWRTAEDAAHLKAASGASQRGRRNLAPVKTISLAWAPGQAPSRHDMTAAADAFLLAMGWNQHQAIYVAHGDTAHPHLHIILNRIHPDTGRTLNDWQERKRAQAWALAYERQQGAVLCKARIARREPGATPAPAGLPHAQAKLLSTLSPSRRRQLARSHRARFRTAWARQLRRDRARLAELASERRALHRNLPSLLREADFCRAEQSLVHLHRRQADAMRLRSFQRAALRVRQHSSLTNRLRPAGVAAANDNAIVMLRRAYGAPQSPGSHTLPLPRSPAAIDLHGLAALQQHERTQLLAIQAAARALAHRHSRVAGAAGALARREIAVAFAGRWAAIRRLPVHQRAAAAAALKTEQAAALSARLSHHLGRLRAHLRATRLALASEHTQARRALAHRHRLAWDAAASAVSRPRPARAPPPRPSATSNRPYAACP